MPSRCLPLRAVLPIVTMLAGCSGSSTGPGGGTPAASITATVDGVPFASTTAQANAVTTTPGSIAFSGSQIAGATVRNMTFNLAYIPGVGTYPLGTNIGSTPGGVVSYLAGTNSYTTPLSGTAGSITISTLSATRVAGTFAFTAAPVVGSGANAVASGGTFDVPLSAGYVAPTAALAGSTMTATIGGTPRVMATVTGLGGGTDSRTLGGQDLTWSISISLGPFSAPGSGALTGFNVPLRRITIQRIGTTQSWGGAGSDVGTLAITTLSATRITGTFTGTLAPNGATTGTLTVTDGTFNVRTP